MKIEVLGTGGALSEKSTAYLVEDTILVDCGLEIIKDLIKNRPDEIKKIEILFLTHLHMDHVSGIELFIYYLQFYNKNIKIYAGEDFIEFYKNLKCSKNVNGEYYQPFKFINLSEKLKSCTHNIYELNNIFVNVIKSNHMNNSIPAFSFTFSKGFKNNNPKIIISGDTDIPILTTNKLLELMNGYLFHDMGWTGLEELTNIHKAHPTEEDIFNNMGESDRIYGIHINDNVKLKHYKKAEIKKYLFS